MHFQNPLETKLTLIQFTRIVHQLICNKNTIQNLTTFDKSWLSLINNWTNNSSQTISKNLWQNFIHTIYHGYRTKVPQILRTINFKNQHNNSIIHSFSQFSIPLNKYSPSMFSFFNIYFLHLWLHVGLKFEMFLYTTLIGRRSWDHQSIALKLVNVWLIWLLSSNKLNASDVRRNKCMTCLCCDLGIFFVNHWCN